MPTTGLWRVRFPVEPRNGAEPKLKIPPSEPTSQYPCEGFVDAVVIGPAGVPVPENEIVQGPEASSALTIHVSVTFPTTEGVKTTASVRVSPGVSVVPSESWVEALKGPVAGGFDFVIVRFVPPVLDTVNDRVELEPTATDP
jgi:hypothetical protein